MREGVSDDYLYFLSHLSGDEDMWVFLLAIAGFLSHLSGDEVAMRVSQADAKFLSHLSGDEDN